MNWEELQHHLEPDNIGTAPGSIKFGVFAFLFVAIIAAGIYFDTTKQLKVLERHEKKEFELREEFKVKADQAAKLDLYKEQLAEMEASIAGTESQADADGDAASTKAACSRPGRPGSCCTTG